MQCICATLLLTALSCLGFLPGIPQWVDGADALYSLQYSVARSQGAVHKVLFNETSSRPSFVIVTGQTPGENIFTWKHLNAVKQLDRLIRGQTVDPRHGRRIGIPRAPEYNVQPPLQDKMQPPVPQPPSHFNASLGSELEINEHQLPESINRIINLINNPLSNRAGNDRGDAGREVLTFQDICIRNPFGDCTVTGVQEMGVEDTRMLFGPDDPPILLVFDGLVFNTQKRAIPPHYVLGKATEVPCSPELPRTLLALVYPPERLMPGSNPGLARANMSCITAAQAYQLVYEIQDSDELQRRNEDWEKVFIDVLNDNREFGPLRLTLNAFRSRDDALRASTSESSDILYVGLTFGLLMAYSTSMNFSCDLYRSKVYPAIAGLLAATLGLITGMGVMALLGIAFVPTALVCPFLVIGVGTDDLFVIINSYAMTYMVDSPRYRCIIACRESGNVQCMVGLLYGNVGLGISMTSITSLVSFLIGINSFYLSIKNFCWFAGSGKIGRFNANMILCFTPGMLFGYIYVFTFFFPIHCMDARREGETQTRVQRKEAQKQCNYIQGPEIGIYTLGALLVRRAEHNAMRRHALRQRILTNSKDPMVNGEYPPQDPLREHSEQYNEAIGNDTDDYISATQGTRSPEALSSSPLPSERKHHKSASETYRPVTTKRQHAKNERFEGELSPHLFSCRFGPQKRNRFLSCFHHLIDKAQKNSDALLTRIALEGHYAGLKHGVDASPSWGVLDFSRVDPEACSTGDPLVDILHHPHIPLHYRSLVTGDRKLFLEEPKGNVGRKWHQFFIRYYGALLVHPWTKIAVFAAFGLFFLISVYGCICLESGLDLRDLAPVGSYLNHFDVRQGEFFDEYDFPVDVFFPERHEWWNLEAQDSLRRLERRMQETGSGKMVTNPVIRMVDDPELKPFLQSGDRETFETALYAALSMQGSKYKQFETNFVWEGTHLRAWKMQILPAPMFSSDDRAAWMTQIRADCADQLKDPYPIVVMAWNYMMTFYESDLMIHKNVAMELSVAAATMLVIALIGISQIKAGLMVILIMGMIDVGIIGFMYFWEVKLNMVSMICLLIAIGFSVDFSAHICHTYMETEGETPNQRVLESLVLMGNPVMNGAASSTLGIMMLGFSESYIFRVFFKVMFLVMIFALAHGIILLPVLLSVASDKRPHHAKHSQHGASHHESLSKSEISKQKKKSMLQMPAGNTAVPKDTETVCSNMRSFQAAKSLRLSDHDEGTLPAIQRGHLVRTTTVPTEYSNSHNVPLSEYRPPASLNHRDIRNFVTLTGDMRRGGESACSRQPHWISPKRPNSASSSMRCLQSEQRNHIVHDECCAFETASRFNVSHGRQYSQNKDTVNDDDHGTQSSVSGKYVKRCHSQRNHRPTQVTQLQQQYVIRDDRSQHPQHRNTSLTSSLYEGAARCFSPHRHHRSPKGLRRTPPSHLASANGSDTRYPQNQNSYCASRDLTKVSRLGDVTTAPQDCNSPSSLQQRRHFTPQSDKNVIIVCDSHNAIS